MEVVGLDHLVLTVASIDRTVAFYEQALGMKAEQFGPESDRRWSLMFGPHKINLHLKGHEFEPKAGTALTGTGDLCFLVDDIDGVVAQLKTAEAEPFLGPVRRTGARGELTSYYLRDPDGNLIELSVYADGTKAAS